MNPIKLMAIITMLALIFSGIALPEAEGQSGVREMKNIHVNLKSNDIFSPEMKHDVNESAEVRHVTANKQQYGNVIVSTDWANVGTWNSDSLDGHLNAQGSVVFNIWFQVTENVANNQVDWEFTLLLNDQVIAQIEEDDTDQSTERPIEITATTQLTAEMNAIPGDSISIRIRYRSAANCDVYFDHQDYDSGASFMMDPVVLFDADKRISARFHDAWGVNWDKEAKYFCFAMVKGVKYSGTVDTQMEDGGDAKGENDTTYETNRIVFVDIPVNSGDSVIVTIAYGPIENGTSESWSIEATKGGGSNGDDDDDGISVAMVGGVVAVVVVLGAVLAYLFVFKKNAEEEYEDEEESEEYEGEEESGEDEGEVDEEEYE